MVKFSVAILAVVLLGATYAESKSMSGLVVHSVEERSADHDQMESIGAAVELGEDEAVLSVIDDGHEEPIVADYEEETKKPTTTVKPTTVAATTTKAATGATAAATATGTTTVKPSTAAAGGGAATTKAPGSGANSIQLALTNIAVSLLAMGVYWIKC